MRARWIVLIACVAVVVICAVLRVVLDIVT